MYWNDNACSSSPPRTARTDGGNQHGLWHKEVRNDEEGRSEEAGEEDHQEVDQALQLRKGRRAPFLLRGRFT